MLAHYNYNNLSKEEKCAYKCVKRACVNLEKNLILPYCANIYKVIEAVRWDCPALFYINWLSFFTGVEFLSEAKIKIKIPYLYQRAEIKKLQAKIKQVVEQFKGVKGEFSIALKVHDYLAYRVKYDTKDASFGGFKYRNHNVIGSLVGKSAVCESIARAYQLLLNVLGVDCMTVVGKTKTNGVTDYGLHAWNVVCIANEYYHVDVTWDLAKEVCGDFRTNYAYFLIDDKTAERDHQCKLKFKCSGKQYNIYSLSNRNFTTKAQLSKFLKRAKLRDNYFVNVKDMQTEVVNECVCAVGTEKNVNTKWFIYDTGILYFQYF